MKIRRNPINRLTDSLFDQDFEATKTRDFEF